MRVPFERPSASAHTATPSPDCSDSVVDLIWTRAKLIPSSRVRRYTWWIFVDFLHPNYEFVPCVRCFLDPPWCASYTRFTKPMPVDERPFSGSAPRRPPLAEKNEGAG